MYTYYVYHRVDAYVVGAQRSTRKKEAAEAWSAVIEGLQKKKKYEHTYPPHKVHFYLCRRLSTTFTDVCQSREVYVSAVY